MGIISTSYDDDAVDSSVNVLTVVYSNSVTKHAENFMMIIFPNIFNGSSHTTTGKNKTMAHEIGHVYGLDEVSKASNIMYEVYSATKNVTSQDIWGMKVVTHVHNHSASTTGTYKQLDIISHEVTCSSCKGKYIQEHTFNSYNVCTKCGYEG